MPVHPLPPGPWVRFVVYQKDSGVSWTNEYWYKLTAVGSVSDWSTLLTNWGGVFSPNWINLMNTAVSVQFIRMYVNNGTFTGSLGDPFVYTGGGANQEIPPQVSAIGAMQAQIGTRQGQGRTFLSGLDSACIDNDLLSTYGTTTVTAFLTAITNWPGSGDFVAEACVWDRKTSTLHAIINSFAVAKLGTRKRRRPKIA